MVFEPLGKFQKLEISAARAFPGPLNSNQIFDNISMLIAVTVCLSSKQSTCIIGLYH